MSEPFKDNRPTDERLCERLRELASFVPEGAWHEFYMRIPADPKHDADLVLDYAATRIDRLRKERDEAAATERRLCAKDVCAYCDGRAVGWTGAQGPNDSGNYTHYKGGQYVLCGATAIFARERWREVQNK